MEASLSYHFWFFFYIYYYIFFVLLSITWVPSFDPEGKKGLLFSSTVKKKKIKKR